jgi:polyhydroxybutyrate depolymerase
VPLGLAGRRWPAVVASAVSIFASAAGASSITSAAAAGPPDDFVAREGLANGVRRTWQMYLPPADRGPRRAIVMLLHGNGGSATQLIGDASRPTAHREWLTVARRERLVLLVPDGLPSASGVPGWNDCRGDAPTNPESDDVGWLVSLFDLARREAAAPQLPAFATGFSNGGHMALRLAIETPAAVRGVAAVAAAMPARSECAAASDAPGVVVLMNGTADPVLPWAGGAVLAGRTPRGSVLSSEDSIAAWTGFTNPPATRVESTTLPDRDRADGSVVTRSLWRDAIRREAILYRIENGGHTAPTRSVPRTPGARQNGDIEMAERIWEDFRRFATAIAAVTATLGGTGALTPSIALAAPAVRASDALTGPLRSTRILVAGGTGRNGSDIVAALEAAGAKPRVLARDVAKAREKFPGEREWVEGDVTRPETLAAAVKGIDVIINAVATSQFDGPNGVEAVDLGGMRNLLAAAKPAGVKRMVLITGMTVGRDPASWSPMMQKGMGIKRETEKVLIASGLDYVILRPTGILPRPANAWAIGIWPQADYMAATKELGMARPATLPPDDAPPPAGTIARKDLAEVAIVSAVDPRSRNRIFVVSHDQGPASAAWATRLERMPRE